MRKTGNFKQLLIALLLLAPMSSHAGGVQVGTAVLLLGQGVANVFVQVPLGDSSAIVATYSTVNGTIGAGDVNATMYSAAYKGYFGDYANSWYWEIGAAQADVTSSTISGLSASGTIPILVGGYEMTLGKNFVFGAEAGLGTGGGWGVVGVAAGINLAYQF